MQTAHFALLLLARAVPGVEEAARSSVVAAAGMWLFVVVAAFAVAISARPAPYLRRILRARGGRLPPRGAPLRRVPDCVRLGA